MAGTDNHRNSGSRRGGIPSFNRNVFRHQVSCLLVLQILSYMSSRRKTWTKWGKYFWVHIWCFFTEILGILFSFHILLSAVKLLEVTMTVRTEFPNV